MEWIAITEKLPDEFDEHYLKYQYSNGYEGKAIGHLDDGKWEIEWSDDFAQDEHVTHWLDEN